MSRRDVSGLVLFAAGAITIALLPRVISEFRAFQFVYVGIYFIAVIGLNVLTGYSGQISLGHGAFMAIGAYTTAILSVKHDVDVLWTIPLAGIISGVVGFAFGFPALRLSGVYLALATFAVAVSVPSVAKRFDEFTGGSGGLTLDLPETRWGLPLSSSDWLYYLTWTIGGVLFVVAWLILRGRIGRALRALRDGEIAAVSSGINLGLYKTLAFGISAFYAGVSGALLAISVAYVNPDTFPITLSILLLTGVVVGGLGSLAGVIVGAIFIEFVPIYSPDILDWLQGPLPVEIDSKAIGIPAVIYGTILVLVMFAMPTGAAGLARALFRPLTTRLYARPTGRAPAPDLARREV